jgi:hypothetical protein
MDIQNIARDYPELLEHVLLRSSGSVGEYLVSEALRQRGFETKFSPGNAKELDLHVTTPGGSAFTVEVKTVRSKTSWWVKRRPDSADYWVFVLAPTLDHTDASFWVYALHEAQELWDANPYNMTHPTAGDIRPHQMRDDAAHAFNKIGDAK